MTAPSWPLPTDVPAAVEAAGLRLGPMGTAEHYHPRLTILVAGQPVVMPAGIGMDPQSGAMSALHTHSSDGELHVEAATRCLRMLPRVSDEASMRSAAWWRPDRRLSAPTRGSTSVPAAEWGDRRPRRRSFVSGSASCRSLGTFNAQRPSSGGRLERSLISW